jgi:hypothetical protein
MAVLAISATQFFNINRQLVNCSVTQWQLKQQGLNLITLNEHGFFDGVQQHLHCLI